jgi:hypothetical protein
MIDFAIGKQPWLFMSQCISSKNCAPSQPLVQIMPAFWAELLYLQALRRDRNGIIAQNPFRPLTTKVLYKSSYVDWLSFHRPARSGWPDFCSGVAQSAVRLGSHGRGGCWVVTAFFLFCIQGKRHLAFLR